MPTYNLNVKFDYAENNTFVLQLKVVDDDTPINQYIINELKEARKMKIEKPTMVDNLKRSLADEVVGPKELILHVVSKKLWSKKSMSATPSKEIPDKWKAEGQRSLQIQSKWTMKQAISQLEIVLPDDEIIKDKSTKKAVEVYLLMSTTTAAPRVAALEILLQDNAKAVTVDNLMHLAGGLSKKELKKFFKQGKVLISEGGDEANKTECLEEIKKIEKLHKTMETGNSLDVMGRIKWFKALVKERGLPASTKGDKVKDPSKKKSKQPKKGAPTEVLPMITQDEVLAMSIDLSGENLQKFVEGVKVIHEKADKKLVAFQTTTYISPKVKKPSRKNAKESDSKYEEPEEEEFEVPFETFLEGLEREAKHVVEQLSNKGKTVVYHMKDMKESEVGCFRNHEHVDHVVEMGSGSKPLKGINIGRLLIVGHGGSSGKQKRKNQSGSKEHPLKSKAVLHWGKSLTMDEVVDQLVADGLELGKKDPTLHVELLACCSGNVLQTDHLKEYKALYADYGKVCKAKTPAVFDKMNDLRKKACALQKKYHGNISPETVLVDTNDKLELPMGANLAAAFKKKKFTNVWVDAYKGIVCCDAVNDKSGAIMVFTFKFTFGPAIESVLRQVHVRKDGSLMLDKQDNHEFKITFH